MPIIRASEFKDGEAFPGVERGRLVNSDIGASHLDMGELLIQPGKAVPMHIHETHEEAMYILDGPFEYVLGDETGVINTGDAMLAPAGVKHFLKNPTQQPKRLLFIFPTTKINRVLVD